MEVFLFHITMFYYLYLSGIPYHQKQRTQFYSFCQVILYSNLSDIHRKNNHTICEDHYPQIPPIIYAQNILQNGILEITLI